MRDRNVICEFASLCIWQQGYVWGNNAMPEVKKGNVWGTKAICEVTQLFVWKQRYVWGY